MTAIGALSATALILPSSDVGALAAVVLLMVGGVALIASGLSGGDEALAARLRLVAHSTGSLATPRTHVRAAIDRMRALAGGLSRAEERQIVRSFSRLRIGRERAIPAFQALRLVTAFAAGALGLLASARFVALGVAPWSYLAPLTAAALGWIAPAFWVSWRARRWRAAVAAGLPDALELLVVCVEAGLSLEDGLRRVANELRDSQPALSDELSQTWAEINILPDRARALANLADRVDDPAVRSVVGVLSQGLRYGAPLAQALRSGVIQMRNDQMTALDEKATRLPALMTIPVMLFLIPALFLIIGGPIVLRVIDVLHHGVR